MATTYDVLVEARSIIADPKNWTTGTLAAKRLTDKLPNDRRPVGNFGDADCFCAVGAVAKAIGCANANHVDEFSCEVAYRGSSEEREQTRLLKTAHKYLMAAVNKLVVNDVFYTVPSFNDSDYTQHSDVLAVFDEAIRMARRRHVRG
jgi:hypothetical protein